jgi:hypothetical protein
MKTTVDLSALTISKHAAEQFHERVNPHEPLPNDATAAYRARGRAVRHLAARLHYANPLPPITDAEGVEAHAWKLAQCVALERGGTVTTIYTTGMYLDHLSGDRT